MKTLKHQLLWLKTWDGRTLGPQVTGDRKGRTHALGACRLNHQSVSA